MALVSDDLNTELHDKLAVRDLLEMTAYQQIDAVAAVGMATLRCLLDGILAGSTEDRTRAYVASINLLDDIVKRLAEGQR